jgi:hypothetical protein
LEIQFRDVRRPKRVYPKTATLSWGISAIPLRRESAVIADSCISMVLGVWIDQVILWDDYSMMKNEKARFEAEN